MAKKKRVCGSRNKIMPSCHCVHIPSLQGNWQFNKPHNLFWLILIVAELSDGGFLDGAFIRKAEQWNIWMNIGSVSVTITLPFTTPANFYMLSGQVFVPWAEQEFCLFVFQFPWLLNAFKRSANFWRTPENNYNYLISLIKQFLTSAKNASKKANKWVLKKAFLGFLHPLFSHLDSR